MENPNEPKIKVTKVMRVIQRDDTDDHGSHCNCAKCAGMRSVASSAGFNDGFWSAIAAILGFGLLLGLIAIMIASAKY